MGKERVQAIGHSLTRVEGRPKANGSAVYVADMVLPGMLFGATVRSPVPRGRIRGITFHPGVDWSSVVVVTAPDIVGRNAIASVVADQPCLADVRVNHPNEPVVLVAHEDPAVLARAVSLVELDIEPEPAVFSIDESVERNEIVYGTDNVQKSFSIEKGDVDAVWANAHRIIEGEYRTSAQEQLYLETNGMIAVADDAEGISVWGSLQCPYYVHGAVAGVMGLPPEKVRIVQLETGGAFGGKEDFPSLLASHAALLARKSGRPVKMIYDRREDMASTTKRHPSRTRHRTAVDAEGRLLAMDVDFVLDGGAYATLSAVVLSRGGLHASGPYFCPNVRIRARAVATNSPPNGAFRGFGAPQSLFAVERHMDTIAQELGLRPEELRRRNLVRDGQTMATGQVLRDGVDVEKLMDRALAEARYHEKIERFARENSGNSIKKGIGFSVFMHGSGFTGSGESYLASVAAVEGTAEGKVRVLAANTEMGQGKNTVFTQIVAETLGIPTESVEVARPDTKFVPNSGPTVASRSTMIVGRLLETASLGLKQILVQSGYLQKEHSPEQFSAAVKGYVEKFGTLKAFSEFQPPAHIRWNDVTYQGDAYSTYAWAVYVAEVEVDTRTFEARVTDFVALQDVGRVVNPVLAAGQIEGGVTQGIGFAIYENPIFRNGLIQNNMLTNYIIPTSVDTPPIRVLFEETPCPWGPGGAKGIGELPLDGPAPAIVNAIVNATGWRVDSVPATPEVLMAAAKRGVGK